MINIGNVDTTNTTEAPTGPRIAICLRMSRHRKEGLSTGVRLLLVPKGAAALGHLQRDRGKKVKRAKLDSALEKRINVGPGDIPNRAPFKLQLMV
jgi:hypothetical protein